MVTIHRYENTNDYGKLVYEIPMNSIYIPEAGIRYECSRVKRAKNMKLYVHILSENSKSSTPLSIPEYPMELYTLRIKQIEKDKVTHDAEFMCGVFKEDVQRAWNIIFRHKVLFDHIGDVLQDAGYPNNDDIDDKARKYAARKARDEGLVRRDLPLRKYIRVVNLANV